MTSLVPGLTTLRVFWSSNRGHAQEQRFSCGQTQGSPTTLAQTKRGQVPVIQWTSDYFSGSGWTPSARCQQVSDLFEHYYCQGTLNYLTTEQDAETRQNVVYVAPANQKRCIGTLFTLKPGSNPSQTLKQLLDLRVRATNKPLNETDGRVYTNDQFLATQPLVAPIEGGAESPKAPSSSVEEIW
ncbi:COP23 domain-containing protein [Acaryochloris sp. IP29b_bin.148]|uniref:COP23 domain-containing protein n=1 Tax=Acaryochloris sp. IP29b_bin.148 TaxID=2969218 RepID=UPI0026153BA8|nr:COP23 domain-containing protein [Acaryochloris sp. IP29b_bin.148]